MLPVEPLLPVSVDAPPVLDDPLELEVLEPDELLLDPDEPEPDELLDPEVLDPEVLEPDEPLELPELPELLDELDELDELDVDIGVSQMPVWVSQTWPGPKQYPPMALQLGRQAPTSVASTGSQT